jgi:cobalt transporter subunit CbtA
VFRRVFVPAILAGLLAGLVVSVVQAAKLWPLIAAAEVYEAPTVEHEAQSWEPGPGPERGAITVLANVVIATGFGLLLSAGFALRQIVTGVAAGAREGLLWGIAGFACFALAPSLGLPPELPGTAAGDLLARQSWWLCTAVATAIGIGAVAFAHRARWRSLGVGLLVLPHLIGAPSPPLVAGTAPAGLAAAFAAASLVAAAVFWTVLGSAGGWLYARLARNA